jgi:hypothetical protein
MTDRVDDTLIDFPVLAPERKRKGYTYSNEQIIAALKQVNGMIYLAARVLGCTPNVIYRRKRRIKGIQEAVDETRGELIDIAEQKLRAAVLDREPWAVAMVLKTIGKDRGYVERQEVTGASGGPIDIREIVVELPKQESDGE